MIGEYLETLAMGEPSIDVDAGVADAVLAAQIGHRNACLVLLQYANDLFFGKSVALHLWSFSPGQSLLQTGLSPRGNVNGHVGLI